MLPFFIIYLLFHILSSLAIIPVSDDRFISKKEDTFRVSSVKLPPEAFSEYLAKTIDSGNKGISSSNIKSTSYSNSTILNLKPGITILQTDDNDECYFVNTTIGTDVFPLIIDTGSAYLWVYGENCTGKACKDRALYTPTASQQTSSTFALQYATGTASGEVVEDNIIVNKLATTEKFKFGLAESVPDFFSSYPVSGIFGLPSNDSSSIQSIISVLYDSHAISVEKFSLSLGNVTDDTDQYSNSGIFAIGDPLDELYTGDISYTDLLSNTNHYWLVQIDTVSINDYKVNFTDKVNISDSHENSAILRKAIVDSGTTVLVLPKQDAIDLHSYFPNSVSDGTNFAIFCNSTLTIELDINGTTWPVKPSEYLGAKYSNDSGYSGYCVSNIQGLDSSADDSWILGAVFLKTVYAVFDLNEQRLGLAKRNTNVVLTSTSTATSTSDASSTATHSSSSSLSSAISSTFSSTLSSTKAQNGAAVMGTKPFLSFILIFFSTMFV